VARARAWLGFGCLPVRARRSGQRARQGAAPVVDGSHRSPAGIDASSPG
jgi:hypothetical protein